MVTPLKGEFKDGYEERIEKQMRVFDKFRTVDLKDITTPIPAELVTKILDLMDLANSELNFDVFFYER